MAGVLGLAIVGLNAASRVDVEFRPAVVGLPPTLTAVLLGLGLPFVFALFVFRAVRGHQHSAGRGSAIRKWLILAGILLLAYVFRDLFDPRSLETVEDTQPDQGSGPVLLPGWSAGITGLSIVLLVGAGLLLLLRPRRALGEEAAAEPPTAPASVGALAADPGSSPAPEGLRGLLVTYYAKLEAHLADAGAPRGAAETQTELLDRATADGLVPATPAGRLTQLFVTARFSDHPVSPEHVAAARSALADVESALGQQPESMARPAGERWRAADNPTEPGRD